MTEKERNDVIALVMAEIMGKCDAKASDDYPIKVSFYKLLSWYDLLESCLCGETSIPMHTFDEAGFDTCRHCGERREHKYHSSLADTNFKQVFDFLNSIEGAGYGGMAEFEIARETMRRLSVTSSDRDR